MARNLRLHVTNFASVNAPHARYRKAAQAHLAVRKLVGCAAATLVLALLGLGVLVLICCAGGVL